jgi:hypothetical protein
MKGLKSIESGEQRRRSVALVVVRHGAGPAAFQRQAGLGTVQSLNLAFLVAAQHQGVFRRIQIQTDNVLQFLGKVWVGGYFEGFHSMRFEPVLAPDTPHCGGAEAHRDRHRPRGPVSAVGWLLLRGFVNHLLYLGGGDARRAPRSWRITASYYWTGMDAEVDSSTQATTWRQ